MPNETLHTPELVVPPGWQCIRLDDLVDETRGISYGIVQPGKHDDAGVPIVRVNNIRDGRLLTDDVMRVSPDIEANYRRTRLKGGEVLLSLVGTLGECAVVPPTLTGWNVARAVAVIPLRDGIDPKWIAMCLGSAEVQSLVRGWATTTVQATLNLRDVRRLPILLAPEPERSDITRAVKHLDDKIEHNRQTGRRLEALARGMFKAWFVDFEPVHAKAGGATSYPGMPAAVFDALPTSFTDSPLGAVPLGWGPPGRVSDLERAGVLLVGDGYRAKRSELAAVGAPFIRAGNVDGAVSIERAELLGEAAVARAGVKRSQPWDTVFTSKGTVGRLGLVTPDTGDVVYAPQVCFWRSTAPHELSPFFLHLWMHSTLFTSQWMSVKGQTDMADFVSLSDQRAMPLLQPPVSMQKALDAMVVPLIHMMAHLAGESRRLATLRDYLLPRLLSGEVRVKAAQAAVG